MERLLNINKILTEISQQDRFKCYISGGGIRFPGKKHYEGVRLNVIRVTRGCVPGWVSNVQEKSVT